MEAVEKYRCQEQRQIVRSTAKGFFRKLLHSSKSIAAPVTQPAKEIALTDEEIKNQIKKLTPKGLGNEDKEVGKLAREVSFLSRMISGDFEQATMNTFRTDSDKEFFKKFNELTGEEMEQKYSELENKLIQVTS